MVMGQALEFEALGKQNFSLDLGVACVRCMRGGGDSQNTDKNLPERGSR